MGSRRHHSPLRRLRFPDESLERRYRRLDGERTPPPARALALIGLAVVVFFAVVDSRLLGPATVEVILPLRVLTALGPLAALLLTFRLPRSQWSGIVAAGLLAMGVADAAIVAGVGQGHRALYQSGVLVIVALAYTVRLPFGQSLLVGLTISVADVAALTFAAGPTQEKWVGVCYLLGINAAGWLSAHRAEAMQRQQFLDHVVLQGEHRELIRLSRRLERLSMRDELTGLGNRRELSERLAGELAAAERSGVPLTLALIDLDHFKEVNDRLGHAAGDELLRQVALQLGQQVRRSDAIFRLGGDEFCVVMPATTGLGGRQMIERTLADLQKAVVAPFGGGTVHVGFSAGCAASRPADTIADLLERADAELYRAKRAGRGKVCSEEVPLQLRAG